MTNNTEKPADQLVERAVQLRMKAGLFIFSQRGAVDIHDPETAVVPLGVAQGWMTEFSRQEVQAERERIVKAIAAEKGSAEWCIDIEKCIKIVGGK